MTGHPDLTPEQASDITDGELAEMHERSLGPGRECSDARRLIAALRASREELRAVMDTGTETITELSRDLRASRGEVERLRSFLSDLDRKQYEAEVLAEWRSQQ